jgi:amino acid permease
VVFLFDKTTVSSISDNFNKLEAIKFTSNGLISSFPLIVYAYMYQVNIPMIYVELETRTPK